MADQATDTTPKAPSASDIGAAVAANLAPEFERILKDVAAAKPAAAAPEPKDATDTELSQLVARGAITQAQADALKSERDTKRLRATVKDEVLREVRGEAALTATQADIARYVELEPALGDRNSEISKRAAAAYKRLIGRGLPDSQATQLAAVEQVLGPLDALTAARTPGRRETHEETGGTGGGSAATAGGDDAPADLFKGVENRWRAHYRDMIGKGQYQGWDDPDLKAELDIIRTAKKKH